MGQGRRHLIHVGSVLDHADWRALEIGVHVPADVSSMQGERGRGKREKDWGGMRRAWGRAVKTYVQIQIT